MNGTFASTEDDYQPGLYEIRIKGYLDDRQAARFEGLTLTQEENGRTLLFGRVDQAALPGLLKKVRYFGMPMVSIIQT